MFQVGDLIYHSQLCTYGIIASLYTGWDNKYCKVLWFSTGLVTEAIRTQDLKKVS
jgi:hypothetical protein